MLLHRVQNVQHFATNHDVLHAGFPWRQQRAERRNSCGTVRYERNERGDYAQNTQTTVDEAFARSGVLYEGEKQQIKPCDGLAGEMQRAAAGELAESKHDGKQTYTSKSDSKRTIEEVSTHRTNHREQIFQSVDYVLHLRNEELETIASFLLLDAFRLE